MAPCNPSKPESNEYRLSRREVIPSLVAFGVLAGCSDNSGQNEDTGVIFEEGQSHSFDGAGPSETERFALDRGLMQYSYTSTSEDILTTELVDMDRDGNSEFIDDRSLTNYRAPIEGELMNIVSGGTYLIGIEVEGNWSIEIDQPPMSSNNVSELPFDASGTEPTYLGPVELQEDTEVRGMHEGEGVFSVHSITVDGLWDVPINDGGNVDSTRVFRDEGIAWINVVGNGDWSIQIE